MLAQLQPAGAPVCDASLTITKIDGISILDKDFYLTAARKVTQS
ncbi:hypothetical protein [Hyphomicrobium sp.]|nr:hypothetical protein [Hyphomicrobium sp.]